MEVMILYLKPGTISFIYLYQLHSRKNLFVYKMDTYID